MTSRISKICVLALFLFSCGGNAATSVTISSEAESVSTGIDGGSGTVYDSSYQDAILEDGVVTYSEYRRAKLDVVSCMEEKGYEARLDESMAPVVLMIEHVVSGVGDDADARDSSAYGECESLYSSRVEVVYTSQVSYDDFLKAMFVARLECAAEMGYEIGEIEGVRLGELSSRFDDLALAHPEVADCMAIGKERALEEWETRIP